MGKTGYLPDIATKFTYWNQYCVNALNDKDWKGAEGGLYNINSLLTPDYEITISTMKYQASIAATTSWECQHCHVKIPYQKIKIIPMILSNIQSFVHSQKTENAWFCTECKKENTEAKTNIYKEVLPNPYYRKVVPDPPIQKFGLQNRFNFEHDFRQWYFLFLKELQHQLALYRIEYVSQNGKDMIDIGYVDKGDE